MPHSTISDSSDLSSLLHVDGVTADVPRPQSLNDVTAESQRNQHNVPMNSEMCTNSRPITEVNLEDIFDEDEDEEDQEFSSSGSTNAALESSPPAAQT